MTRARTTIVLALAAGAMLAASPAFAWTCTAKNARGAHYTAVRAIKANAIAHALNKCKIDSAAPATCHIISCTLP